MNKMKQLLSKRLVIGLLTLLMPIIVLAQDITVQGTVTDEAGETLIGATVQQKGTSNGTVTDFEFPRMPFSQFPISVIHRRKLQSTDRPISLLYCPTMTRC